MAGNWKWWPFVPEVHSNAQAVIDPQRGGTVDCILLAGAEVDYKRRLAEVFAVYPGKEPSLLDHYLDGVVMVRETAWSEERGYWKTEFQYDASGKHRIEAEYLRLPGNQVAVRLTGVNQADVPARWVVTCLAGPNDRLEGAKVDRDGIVLPTGGRFSIQSSPAMVAAPPVNASVPLDGLFTTWGHPQPSVAYPEGFAIRLVEWQLPPQATQVRWIMLGEVAGPPSEASLEALAGQMDAVAAEVDRAFPAAPEVTGCATMKHLACQLAVNRRYPPHDSPAESPQASFTPCASMEREYLWDAGYAATGLAAVDRSNAYECIRQYLPHMPDTLWPHVVGAKIPTHLTAAWELYQQTIDDRALRDFYPGLHELWRCSVGLSAWPTNGYEHDQDQDGLLCPSGGGTGLDDAPTQVWTRGYSIDWARQEHYWPQPIETNPTGAYLPTESVNMTAYGILGAKMLKLAAQVLGEPIDESYDAFISKAEASLQRHCWNEDTGHFHWVEEASHRQLPVYDLSGLTPLFSASWQDDRQREVLIDRLMSVYLTPHGLTTVDTSVPFYRRAYWCGAVWFPFHWMFWKALLGLGRLAEARAIALPPLKAYIQAHEQLGICCEKFDLETGRPAGDIAFSGLAGPMMNLWAGYFKPGTLSVGFLTVPTSVEFSDDLGSATVQLASEERSDTAAGVVVLAPEADYDVRINGESRPGRTDARGALEFTFPVSREPMTITFQRSR